MENLDLEERLTSLEKLVNVDYSNLTIEQRIEELEKKLKDNENGYVSNIVYKTNNGDSERYNIIDAGAVNRLKSYVDMSLNGILSPVEKDIEGIKKFIGYAKTYEADIISIIREIQQEIYNQQTNEASSSRIDTLNENIKKLGRVLSEEAGIEIELKDADESPLARLESNVSAVSDLLKKLGYDIELTTSKLTLPKNADYLSTDISGKMIPRKSATYIGPTNTNLVTAATVFQETKEMYRNGDMAKLGSCDLPRTFSWESTDLKSEEEYEIRDLRQVFKNIIIDTSFAETACWRVRNDDEWPIQINQGTFIYVPVTLSGKIYFRLYYGDSIKYVNSDGISSNLNINSEGEFDFEFEKKNTVLINNERYIKFFCDKTDYIQYIRCFYATNYSLIVEENGIRVSTPLYDENEIRYAKETKDSIVKGLGYVPAKEAATNEHFNSVTNIIKQQSAELAEEIEELSERTETQLEESNNNLEKEIETRKRQVEELYDEITEETNNAKNLTYREADARREADEALEDKITELTVRTREFEDTIQTFIDEELDRNKETEEKLQQSVETLSNNLDNTNIELEDEFLRASEAEEELQQSVKALNNNLDNTNLELEDEIVRATETEEEISSKLSQTIEQIKNGELPANKAENDINGESIVETYARLDGASIQGDFSVDGFATFNKDASVNGDLVVKGNIIQEGESKTYETHVEELYSEKSMIITRDGALTGLHENEFSGIKIKNYDGKNDGLLIFDNKGTARVGDNNGTQPLATREEHPINGGSALWNETENRFVTLVLDGSNLNAIYKEEENTLNKIFLSIEKDLEEVGLSNDSLAKKLDDEIERAAKAEEEITDSLNDEIERAENSEKKITNILNDEIERAMLAEKNLSEDLVDETERAKKRETSILNSLDGEIERATKAEEEITDSLNDEIERATKAEEEITNSLNDEIERATKAEEEITEAVTALQEGITNSLNDEIERATKAEEEITEAVTTLQEDISNGKLVASKAEFNDKGEKFDDVYARLDGADFSGEVSFDKSITANKGATITGDLVIKGNIYNKGSVYETHAEEIYSSNDLIILRDGAESGLAGNETAGIRVKNYNGKTDGLLVVDNKGIARVGDEGDLQPLATREESPINGGVAVWEQETFKFKTKILNGDEIEATYEGETDKLNKILLKVGKVKTVNGQSPDTNGNIFIDSNDIEATYEGETLTLNEILPKVGKVKTVNNKLPDENGNIALGNLQLMKNISLNDFKNLEKNDSLDDSILYFIEGEDEITNISLSPVNDDKISEENTWSAAKIAETIGKHDGRVKTVNNIEPDEHGNVTTYIKLTKAEYNELNDNDLIDDRIFYEIIDDEVNDYGLLPVNDEVTGIDSSWTSSKIRKEIDKGGITQSINNQKPDSNGNITVNGDTIEATYEGATDTINNLLPLLGKVKTVNEVSPDTDGNISITEVQKSRVASSLDAAYIEELKRTLKVYFDTYYIQKTDITIV